MGKVLVAQMAMKLTRRDSVAAIGGIILLGLFFFTVFGPCIPSDSRFHLLIIQAIAGAATAGALLGKLEIKGNALGFAIEAGGTIAVAVLVFVAGLNMQLAKGHMLRIGSPTLKNIVGKVTIESGALILEEVPDEGVINSPTLDGVEGEVNLSYRDVTVKKAPRQGPDGCRE